ncbi:hypothetical protein SA87_07935 [Hydrogenibacillus schlegelii]|uniref:Uncharacterized protein n=1 Tax=Hydrogenibacillus schlegelii TaxID=1484 RepID=A0A179IU97_HYDSH|nr:hypothetical protein SA87_07935 [Hydrogenibacillus schlegelii]PTQ54661.1 MAG: hypothetical protein HSCHL_2252 [Hydrogenibacillus schlegelii]
MTDDAPGGGLGDLAPPEPAEERTPFGIDEQDEVTVIEGADVASPRVASVMPVGPAVINKKGEKSRKPRRSETAAARRPIGERVLAGAFV